MKYTTIQDGEWEYPRRKGFKLRCCDCGLVHQMNFAIEKDKRGSVIKFQVFRDTKATASSRRYNDLSMHSSNKSLS